ncbi:hypothetical protein [Streptomyces virginiae]|uniref:hypothetical protein n=1 Tax=Streptomyces virginiae TaxID=1961 RepID=UPI0036578249
MRYTLNPADNPTIPAGRYAWTATAVQKPRPGSLAQDHDGTWNITAPVRAHDAFDQILANVRQTSGWPDAGLVKGSIWTV